MHESQSIVLTEAEAANMLSVSQAALRRWRREKRGPNFLHVERCVRYRVDDLRAYLEQCAARPAARPDESGTKR
jgi:predicted transcriptional regulator